MADSAIQSEVSSVCGICETTVDINQPHVGCTTQDCVAPFRLHIACAETKLKSQRAINIACLSCEEVTSISRNYHRFKPLMCFRPSTLLHLAKIIIAIVVLSFLPYGLLFYFGNPERLDRPYYIWAVVSWIMVSVVYVFVKITVLLFRICSYPVRSIVRFVTRLMPMGPGETAEDSPIVATARKKHK